MCLAPVATQAQTYRWVDQNGVSHYSDRLPPNAAKQRREVLNEHGQVITVKQREATAEELARAEAERQQAEAAAALAERQAQYDRSLTATYSNVSQLDAAYASRVAIIEGKIKSARKTYADIEAMLAPLRERAAGDEAEAGLDKRIQQTQARLAEQTAIIQRLEIDRDEIRAQHQADRARFLTLTQAQ